MRFDHSESGCITEIKWSRIAIEAATIVRDSSSFIQRCRRSRFSVPLKLGVIWSCDSMTPMMSSNISASLCGRANLPKYIRRSIQKVGQFVFDLPSAYLHKIWRASQGPKFQLQPILAYGFRIVRGNVEQNLP